MKRAYKSGCEKRKKKHLKDIETAQSSKSLSSWLTGPRPIAQTHLENNDYFEELTTEDCPCNQPETALLANKEQESSQQPHNDDNPSDGIIQADQTTVEAEPSTSTSTYEKDETVSEPPFIYDVDSELDLCDVFPRVVKDSEMKRKLIRGGPYQPNGPFPRDQSQKGRCFSNNFYTLTTKSGLKLTRNWLCYSRLNDCVYCLPCWLFSLEGGGNVSGNHRFSTGGVRDWKHISERIASHEGSKEHAHACIIYDTWMKNQTVEDQIGSQYEDERRFWRNVIERVLDVTLTLATCNLAFRGSSEKLESSNKGNFLSIIELLSKYDPVLQKLLLRPQGTTKYLSKNVQNELIELLAAHVRKEILRELQSASFFSVIFDTTQDISKVDQLSEVYRYVTIQNDDSGKPKNLKICEVFYSFTEVKDQTAEGLAGKIVTAIEEKGLQLSKCLGQGYDGAAVMSGVYNGVQRRIIDKAPNAYFVHCSAHNLNLVLKDAVEESRDVCQFFETIQTVYCFFGHSIVRWEVLQSTHQGQSQGDSSKKTLKSLNPTRWAGRFDAVNALKHRFCEVLKALSTLILTSKKKKEVDEAIQLKKKLESFKFVLLLVIQHKILETINIVSKVLQGENIDLLSASKMLQNAHKQLLEMREDFEQLASEASKICQSWGIPQHFEKKRNIKIKRHFDELCEDERLQEPESQFKVMVFFPVMDTLCSQLQARFEGMRSVLEAYKIIQPEFLFNASDKDIQKAAVEFVTRFPEDVSPAFPSQMLSVKNTFQTEFKLEKISSVKELADLLMIKHSISSSAYPDVCTALIMYMTVPVTVAKAERSFSKLKLIKNYLRNAMGQDRLSNLALLSIENKLAKKVNFDEVINQFASSKVRKRDF